MGPVYSRVSHATSRQRSTPTLPTGALSMTFRDAWHRGESTVTCIACGESISRSDAREYDKHGDRWERTAKSFEYLCKPCDRQRCHSPRDGLEDRLVAVGTGGCDPETFVARYLALARDDDAATPEE